VKDEKRRKEGEKEGNKKKEEKCMSRNEKKKQGEINGGKCGSREERVLPMSKLASVKVGFSIGQSWLLHMSKLASH